MSNTHPNFNHEYNTQSLGYIVEEPINGNTDCYVLAAFEDEGPARRYVDYLNLQEPWREFPFRVVFVGTRYRDESGNII